MRQQIDLAWLRQDLHQTWFQPLMRELAPALDKIRLCELPRTLLDNSPQAAGQKQGDAAHPPGLARPTLQSISSLFLAKSLIQLRRYDALLITVSIETLAWTRQCLAAVPRGHVLPIVGVCQGLRCGAMLDLMELGMSDFVCMPLCPQEFRARLIHVVSRSPKSIGLREPVKQLSIDSIDPRQPDRPRPGTQDKQARHSSQSPQSSHSLKISELVWPNMGFQENKQRMIDLFEKHYLRVALRQANGNISEAARRASKDRRAFWELMRRHGIKSTSKSA